MTFAKLRAPVRASVYVVSAQQASDCNVRFGKALGSVRFHTVRADLHRPCRRMGSLPV
jgi:hypothetical protein